MLNVILGPQTRLAEALLSSACWESGARFVLVARNVEEHDALKLAHPSALVYRAWEPESPLPEEADRVALIICALGVIHPGSGISAVDLQRTDADYRAFDAILEKYSKVPLHVVFISSVLALSPRRQREYYAGWKNVVEAMVRQQVERDGARLSVLYPGRLVETKTLREPSSLLHSSYRELAEEMISMVRENRSRAAAFGIDARLWLAFQSCRLFVTALTGRR